MPELIEPTTRLREQWLASYREWPPGVHIDGAGLAATDDVESPEGFAAWVARLRRAEDRSIPPDAGWVHTTYRWITDGDRHLGAIALRHDLNDFLREVGGHIGYGVRPSERGRGHATFALARTLDAARELGLGRVLITCRAQNIASARTIERAGGVLEDVRDTDLGAIRRYWIEL
nr:GNAT family N-acetyltransferase [uncultured Actinoplanes sp.]